MPMSHDSSHASTSRLGSLGRRSDDDIDLEVSSSTSRRRRATTVSWPWPAVLGAGTVMVILGQWAILGGLLAPEWLHVPDGSFSDVIAGAGELWLSAHGVPFVALGMQVGLAPLGLTLAILWSEEEVARHAGRAMARADAAGATWRRIGELAALQTSIHVAAAAIIGASVGTSSWGRLVLGALLVGLSSGLIGACRGAGRTPFEGLPSWAGGLPRAIAVTVAVVVAGGALAAGLSLLVHAGRVLELHRALGAGGWSGIGLVLIELAWLPTFILWAVSWCLGAGFAVGTGSWASPLGTHLGLAPALPVLGALPDNTVAGTGGAGWSVLWLLVPVVAAVLGTLVVVLGRPDGFELCSGLGLATGAGAGLVLGAAATLAHGSLGAGRLAQVGPTLPDVWWLAVGLLGLVGMITGFTVGTVRWHRDPVNVAARAERVRARQEAEDAPTAGADETVGADETGEVDRSLAGPEDEDVVEKPEARVDPAERADRTDPEAEPTRAHVVAASSDEAEEPTRRVDEGGAEPERSAEAASDEAASEQTVRVRRDDD